MYKYDKEELKKELTLEQVYDLLTELGAEPILKDNCIICKTICHNSDLTNASHKLYYYSNTHLFHCYTGCGDASFDIYDLVLRVNKTAGIQNFSLPRAIAFVARYFGYTAETFNFKDNQETSEDWQIFDKYEKANQVYEEQKRVEFKTFDDKILRHLPRPRYLNWERDGITKEVCDARGICYDPANQGIVIPHYDINGNLIGIRERTLIKEEEQYGKYRPAFIDGKLWNHPLGFNLYNLNWSKNNIKTIGTAIVFEGEKSCLQFSSYFGLNSDITCAVCGNNFSRQQFNLLYSLGVKEIIIGYDKQYHEDFGQDWADWTKKFIDIYNKYGKYVQISFIVDRNNLLDYKDSPTDKGKETFLQLYSNRETI